MKVGQEDEPPAARIFVGATTHCDSGFAHWAKYRMVKKAGHKVA